MDHRRMEMNKYLFLVGVFSLFFTGCISVTKELPPFSTYTIMIEKEKTEHTKNSGYALNILEPKALGSTNNILISYTDKNYRSENYALSKWSDKPTKLLQYTITNYLSETKNYEYVHNNKLSIPSDIHLLSELHTFTQQLHQDKPYIDFSITVFMMTKKELKTKKFSYQYPSKDRSAQSAVEAFNKSVNQFVQDLDKWILSHIES